MKCNKVNIFVVFSYCPKLGLCKRSLRFCFRFDIRLAGSAQLSNLEYGESEVFSSINIISSKVKKLPSRSHLEHSEATTLKLLVTCSGKEIDWTTM